MHGRRNQHLTEQIAQLAEEAYAGEENDRAANGDDGHKAWSADSPASIFAAPDALTEAMSDAAWAVATLRSSASAVCGPYGIAQWSISSSTRARVTPSNSAAKL